MYSYKHTYLYMHTYLHTCIYTNETCSIANLQDLIPTLAAIIIVNTN